MKAVSQKNKIAIIGAIVGVLALGLIVSKQGSNLKSDVLTTTTDICTEDGQEFYKLALKKRPDSVKTLITVKNEVAELENQKISILEALSYIKKHCSTPHTTSMCDKKRAILQKYLKISAKDSIIAIARNKNPTANIDQQIVQKKIMIDTINNEINQYTNFITSYETTCKK